MKDIVCGVSKDQRRSSGVDVPSIDEWTTALQDAFTTTKEQEGLTAHELSEILGWSKGKVHKFLRRMIAANSVQAHPYGGLMITIDGRKVTVPSYSLIEKVIKVDKEKRKKNASRKK